MKTYTSTKKPSNLQTRIREWYYKHLIKKYLKDCKTILDVGCGIGQFIDIAKKQGKDVYGVDLTKENVDINLKKGNNVKLMPYQKWKEEVDAVFASQMIEHTDGYKFMAKMQKICAKKIIIITPKPYMRMQSTYWKKRGSLSLCAS